MAGYITVNVGDPIVIDGSKHRIKRIEGTTVFCRLSFKHVGPDRELQIKDLRWDGYAGVWREERDDA